MRDLKKVVTLLFGVLLLGCAATLPARPNKTPCQDVCLTAPGWATSTTAKSALVVVVVHNPRAVLVEATLTCGLQGKAPHSHVVRVPAGLEQELHFAAERELGFGSFSCELVDVKTFSDLTPELGALGGAQ